MLYNKYKFTENKEKNMFTLANTELVKPFLAFMREMTSEGHLDWDILKVNDNTVIRLDSQEGWIEIMGRIQCFWKGFTFNLYLGIKDGQGRYMLHIRSPGSQWQMISEEDDHYSKELSIIYCLATANVIKLLDEIKAGDETIYVIKLDKNKIINEIGLDLSQKLDKGLDNFFGI